MDHSKKTGFSFGITSAIITTLGLIVGLNAGTHSRLAIIGGVLIIAVADAFSDALGIHISEESENKHTTKEIYTATVSTWLTKFAFAMTFVVPVLILPVQQAVIASVIWGMLLLTLFSIHLADGGNKKHWKVVGEHLAIASAVILITNYLGILINSVFGSI